MLRLEARLYGHWGIPLLSSGQVHSLDSYWFLVQWMGILVCVYSGLLNMLQVRYWVIAHFIFCLPAGAVEPVSVCSCCFILHVRVLTSDLAWSSSLINPSEISSTIGLLNCEQLRLHLSRNKCFWLLRCHCGTVWILNAKVNELD